MEKEVPKFNINVIITLFMYMKNVSIIFFNLFLDTTSEAEGGSPCFKKKSFAKLIKIKEHFDLCDIWRLQNCDVKQFTFRQKYVSGFIQ